VFALLSMGQVSSFTPRVMRSNKLEIRPVSLFAVAEDQEAKVAEETTESEKAVMEPLPDIEGFDGLLIKMGLKDDLRIPEEERVDAMTKIKAAGTAGIVSYAGTELAFWVISVPLAVAGVALTTGSLPDLSTTEGQAAVGGYSLAFLTFARAIVPLRIGLALALTPWVQNNVMSKFEKKDE